MMLSPASQIAQRQIDYFRDRHVLLAGELQDDFYTELLPVSQSVSVFTTNFAYAEKVRQHKDVTCHYGAEITEESHADMVLLYWPKAKAEASYLLTMLMSALGKGTEICIVGENRSGVKSIEKLFAAYGKVNKFDSARRCSFYWGECTESPAPFVMQDWFKSYQVNYQNTDFMVKALPGVFSQNELDAGSRLLVDNLSNISGKVLDFGCGAGVIGGLAKLKNPHIDLNLCDISALAIESTKATLEANNIEGNVFTSDIYSNVQGRYRAIISNPPFHAGLKTYYAATESFLEQAPRYLRSGGSLMIVANSFLKYSPIIEQAFGHCNQLDKTSKFVIYQAIK